MKMTCGCQFVGVGLRFNNKECQPFVINDKQEWEHTHMDNPKEPCEGDRPGQVCTCTRYLPKYEPKSPNRWPVCVCGHAAEAHN